MGQEDLGQRTLSEVTGAGVNWTYSWRVQSRLPFKWKRPSFAAVSSLSAVHSLALASLQHKFINRSSFKKYLVLILEVRELRIGRGEDSSMAERSGAPVLVFMPGSVPICITSQLDTLQQETAPCSLPHMQDKECKLLSDCVAESSKWDNLYKVPLALTKHSINVSYHFYLWMNINLRS